MLLFLLPGCVIEDQLNQDQPNIVGRWRIIHNDQVVIPNSFFWLEIDYLEFREDGLLLGLIDSPPGAPNQLRLNAEVQYRLIGSDQVAITGACRHEDPCTGQYTLQFSENELEISADESRLMLAYVGPPEATIPAEAPGPAATATPDLDQAAMQMVVAFNQSDAIRSNGPFLEIPPGLWADPIQALNPLRIYWHNNNLAIVLSEADDVEQGLYLGVPISSYMPQNDDLVTFHEQADGTLHFSKTAKGNAQPLVNTPTPTCIWQAIPPALFEAQPTTVKAGDEISLIGRGGYRQDTCGGYDESARSFPLYFGDAVVGTLSCYVGSCQATFTVPPNTQPGAYCLTAVAGQCDIQVNVEN